MKIGLDLDGTITAETDFFAFLARAWRMAGGEVHVVTSRFEDTHGQQTRDYLSRIGVQYDALAFTWHKHEYAVTHGLHALIDDLDPFLACLPTAVIGLRFCGPRMADERTAGLAQIEAWKRERGAP